MKKKKIITTAALCLSLCLFTGAKIENVKAEGIAIENPEDIVQYQLGTMRMDVQQEQLDEILNGLETVTLADEKSQKSLTRGDDFLAILLIHEDGQKDIFHFFQENEKWYMQTGDGELYENADFITDIIHVEEAASGETVPSGYTGLSITEEGLLRMIQTDKAEKLAAYAKKEGFYPTEEEIAEEMDMSVDRVREILKISQEPVSLETPIGEEEDSHLGDFIQDDNVPVPADAAAFTLLKEQLVEVLGTLTDREQKVLRLRFGLDDGRARTLEEVGKEFNVTRERIRQIEAKALRKLRHPSRSRKLKDYLD